MANSHFTKGELLKLGATPNQVVVVHPGPNLEQQEVPGSKLKKIIDSDQLKDRKVLLTVGRLVKRKSHDLLVLFNKLKECEHCLKFSKDFEYFLKNLDSFDKKSDRFRYPEDSKGKSYFRSNSPNKKFFEVLNYPEQLKKYVKIVI